MRLFLSKLFTLPLSYVKDYFYFYGLQNRFADLSESYLKHSMFTNPILEIFYSSDQLWGFKSPSLCFLFCPKFSCFQLLCVKDYFGFYGLSNGFVVCLKTWFWHHPSLIKLENEEGGLGEYGGGETMTFVERVLQFMKESRWRRIRRF